MRANPKLAPNFSEPEARTNAEAVAEADVEVVELETVDEEEVAEDAAEDDETADDVEVAELEVKPIGKVSVVLMAASDDAALNASEAAVAFVASLKRTWSIMCRTPLSRRTSGRTICAEVPFPPLTKVPEEFVTKVKGCPPAEVALNVVELNTEELAAMS